MTRIHIGADSGAYHSARALVTALAAAGHDLIWHGAPAYDRGDDYPAIVVRAFQAVIADEDAGHDARGLILSDTGAGEVIVANKVSGARVVSATDPEYVTRARVHADINGLVLPVALLTDDDIRNLVELLLTTAFSGDLDDARRLVNIAEFENAGTIEGWQVEP